MVREDSKEAWVTLAESDLDAIHALVLAKSLEHTFTTRQICISVTKNVSQEMRCLLSEVFNIVLTISDERDGDVLKQGGAKLWCWTWNQFKKCVFLNPSVLVTGNCDNLFKYEELSATLSTNNSEGCFDASVFVFEPNFKTFEKLRNNARNELGNATQVLNSFFNDWKVLEEEELGFISGNNVNWDPNTSKEWIRLYNQYVVPLLENRADKSTQDVIFDIQRKSGLTDPECVPPLKTLVDNLEDYQGTIAVIGMSCRFPGANNTNEYWKLLSSGREAIRQFPLDRPKAETVEFTSIKAGFLDCPVYDFDAKFFEISPREAEVVDPQQRLLLEVTWESLEHAGINPQKLRNSGTGVYVGIWRQDYEKMLHEAEDSDETTDFLHVFLGNKYSATASRISFFLGMNGPALAVESGCSSSLNGLHLACQDLQTGETSLALVSGVNLILKPVNPFSGKSAGDDSVCMSKDFKCKTFDESADGFVRAEGCGAVVLKKFEDAFRDGDNILAVIKGSAVNNDGAGTSFGTPNGKAHEQVYMAALRRSNVNAADVTYIETHGTGTSVGDPIEMHAVSQIYSKNRTRPLIVGSVKTNIGHCESASGIASLIKVILCMKHGAIPPHLNLKTLNPRIDLASIPAEIPMKLTPWNVPKKIAAVSSFSMSATNVHVILQEPPRLNKMENRTDIKQELVTLSAKSDQALVDLCQMYIQYLKEAPHQHENQISDIAYTANLCRAHFQHRIVVLASDSAQLLSCLENGNYVQGKAATLKRNVAFLFTGQGSQYTGMAKGLSEAFTSFETALHQCSELFQMALNQNLENVLWNDESLLNQTVYCQPAIFCVQYSLVQLWSFYGIKPDFVLGHSVGEFAAAVCAGILTLKDAMKLVVERSKLVNDLPRGSMVAIRASKATVAELIKVFVEVDAEKNWVDIAAVNSYDEVVVSGPIYSVERFAKFCMNKELQYVKVSARHAFHSRDMNPVLFAFGNIAETIVVGEATCKYISATLAKFMEPSEFDSQYWQSHLRESVQFSDAVRLLKYECSTFVEIGPQPILLGLTMAHLDENADSNTYAPSLRKKDEACSSIFAALSKLYVTGIDFDWSSVYGIRKKRVNLPFYPFQRQKYYKGYVLKEDKLTPLVHPLLGRQFISPISDLVFCQRFRLEDLDYMEDHKVAGHVVVPVAALLESFLAACREVLHGGTHNRFPIAIENLVVESVLPLDQACQIQTLVSTKFHSKNAWIYKLSLNRKLENHFDKWKKHAEATFTPSSTVPDLKIVDLESLKSRLSFNVSLEDNYKSIFDIGIQFGPKFRSVASAWHGQKELLTKIHLPDQHEKYICHPIVLDAMIQTAALRPHLTATQNTRRQSELYLPIAIKRFTWLARTLTESVYAHTIGDSGDVRLYNSNGETLGILEGLELLKTSTASVLRALQADSNEVPDFICDRWRCVLGKTSSRVDTTRIIPPSVTSTNVLQAKTAIEGFDNDENECVELNNQGTFLVILIAILECGWPWPAVGSSLSAESWEVLLPSSINKGIIGIYLTELEQRGYLVQDKNYFRVTQQLPSCSDCKLGLTSCIEVLRSKGTLLQAELILLERYIRCYARVLKGEMSALAMLFPTNESEGVQNYYTQSKIYNHQNALIRAVLIDSLANYAGSKPKDGIVRILEIGAGSGSTTFQCIEYLREMKIPFQYTFTDISQLFLNKAKEKLINVTEVAYKIFNIEEDPLSQGFVPSEFDIIIGAMVVHATANLYLSIQHLKTLLKVNGLLILGEGFKPHASQLLIFGMLDGWWRFNDFRLNSKMTTLLDESGWETVLSKSGFDSITLEPGYFCGIVAAQNTANTPKVESNAQKKKWVIFEDNSRFCSSLSSHLKRLDREAEMVPITQAIVGPTGQADRQIQLGSNLEGFVYFCTEFLEKDVVKVQQLITSTLLNILKEFAKYAECRKTKPKMTLVTRGVYAIGDSDPGDPNGASAWGMMKVFQNEHQYVNMCLIDLNPHATTLETEQVLSQLWIQDEECFIAFRDKKTFVLRLTSLEKLAFPLQLPLTDRFKLTNPESGAFADIEIGPRSKTEINGNLVEVEVRACALNFRDILMVLKPEGFSLPDGNSMLTLDSVGLDMSGVVVAVGPNVSHFKIGDAVYGMATSGALGSHTLVKEEGLFRIPKFMTFVEACTIPCAFITAYVCLIQLAKITKADRVLIHVATGGVGLAAIQVVNHIGAEIFATAGSKRKRTFLRSLGIKYVYHSRDTSYGKGITRDTKCEDVTVVLNSLTGPNFKETTLSVCGKNARFVEMAQINIWNSEQVHSLRKDVQYTIVDLSTKGGGSDGVAFREVAVHIHHKSYKSLPSVVFQLSQLREAFYYFQKARHIGKVVIQIPKYTVSETGKPEIRTEIFNDRSTYLITGGLGGIGLEVTKWMQTTGAQTIVLFSRTPTKEYVQRLIEHWNQDGKDIVVMHGDVSNYTDCQAVLKSIEMLGLRYLRGVFHAAGVLSDNLIKNQTAESVEYVLRPKVYGGWNLHHLTLGYPIEFFVMFSSITGILGTPGQCNHAGANRVLDALIHHRVAMGLPGTTINWGAWSDVGAAAALANSMEVVAGLKPFTPAQGIAALQNIMISREVQVAVGNATNWNIVKKMSFQGKYLAEMNSDEVGETKAEAHEYLIAGIKNARSPEEEHDSIQTYIQAILKQTLSLPESESIDIDQNFSALGVDSLMAMEIRNRFQTILGDRPLTISALQENSTVRSLSDHLVQLMDDTLA